jgi:hypothetical protein
MDFNGFNGWVLIVIWHHLTRNCGFQWISPREMINQEAGFNYETWSSDMWFTTYRLHHGCHELTSMWSSLQWIICPFSTAHRNWKEQTLRCEKPRKILVHWPFFIHFSSMFHPFQENMKISPLKIIELARFTVERWTIPRLANSGFHQQGIKKRKKKKKKHLD